MKKIIYVTGSRADFGLMYSTLMEINKHPELDLSVLVTAMHLSKKHGYTVEEVRASGLKIESEIKIFDEATNSTYKMGVALGTALIKFAQVFEKLKPDLVLIEGDRFEALAAAIAGALSNILIVHISGGDISKSIDNSIRNAITKIAHIHLPGTQKSAERILHLGEEPWRIRLVGTPINKKFCSRDELVRLLGLDFNKPVILVIQHPVTTQSDKAASQMKETMEAIAKLNEQAVIIYPNTDAGGSDIIKVINEYRFLKNLKIVPNLPSEVFTGLLKNSSVIVGNSSAGIVEAPYFKIPCVNLGVRQKGREHAANVIDVYHKKEDIMAAIKRALTPEFKTLILSKPNPYEVGDVEKRIVDVLVNLEIDTKLIDKGG